jgi:hypothetical protein
MSSAPTAEAIARDATWLAQALDPQAGVVRLVELDRAGYRDASFLDDRVFQKRRTAHLVPWAVVAEAAVRTGRQDARWIFHIGHVGSTLLARLLGELRGVLSIREPRFLRDLASIEAAARQDYASAARALFSRTFGGNEVPLVKATSFVSEIAGELVPEGGKALFMFATPAIYFGSILAGENSVKELHAFAPVRARRLAARVTAIDVPGNDAELAAIAWACEMTSLEAAAESLAGRAIGWVDFDRMLRDLPETLGSVIELLDLGATTAELSSLARSPLVGRYSKALEFEYSPALRRDLIVESKARHGAQITGALAMLQRAAEKSPLLARSLARCGED